MSEELIKPSKFLRRPSVRNYPCVDFFQILVASPRSYARTFLTPVGAKISSVLKFSLPLGPMLTKRKKNPKRSFVRVILGKKNREKFENCPRQFVGGVAF